MNTVQILPLFHRSDAANRWQALASDLEAFTLDNMWMPVDDETQNIDAKLITAGMAVMKFGDTLQYEPQTKRFITDCLMSLGSNDNPHPYVRRSEYSERRAYFIQEVYNIIGYLWSLDADDKI